MSTEDDAALAQLPETWQAWLKLNVARGCAAADLLRDLTLKGNFPPDLARRALQAQSARLSGAGRPADSSLSGRAWPDVDGSASLITLPDRTVTVRASLNTPRVVLLDGLLHADECQALVALGESLAERSRVVDPVSGEAVVVNGRRGRFAHLSAPHPLVSALERRLSALLGWPLSHFETLQAIHYGPGDEYQAHFDFFDPEQPGAATRLGHGGQRVGTLIVYLQTPALGGATAFPAAQGLRILPHAGSALWFRNLDDDGTPDRTTLHTGDPVVTGAKWIISAWLREKAWRSQG